MNNTGQIKPTAQTVFYPQSNAIGMLLLIFFCFSLGIGSLFLGLDDFPSLLNKNPQGRLNAILTLLCGLGGIAASIYFVFTFRQRLKKRLPNFAITPQEFIFNTTSGETLKASWDSITPFRLVYLVTPPSMGLNLSSLSADVNGPNVNEALKARRRIDIPIMLFATNANVLLNQLNRRQAEAVGKPFVPVAESGMSPQDQAALKMIIIAVIFFIGPCATACIYALIKSLQISR